MKIRSTRLSDKIIWLFAFAFLINGCKEPENIGLDVLPSGENMPIAWVDTLTVLARTVTDDSISTSNLAGTYLVGDFGDPVFGRIRSELYTQFLLPSSDVSFGIGAVLDSLVLNLAYAGSYGNTSKLNGTMRFGVYRLNDDIQDTTTYRSNVVHDSDPVSIAEKTFRPDLFSNVIVGNDTLPPSLRIPLSADFGNTILNSFNLASNTDFLTEFKGLDIRSIDLDMPSDHGSILYFNMVSSFTRLELYYHNDTEDSLQFDLLINEDCATHTSFTHDFPAEVLNAINDTTVAGATRLYVQSMAGLKIKLDIPFLKSLSDLGVIAINKAEVVIPIDETVSTDYSYPDNLQMTGIKDDGTSEFLVDFFEGADYYGGSRDNQSNEYVFNVARQLQSVLNHPDKTDNGLYILNSGNAVNARRAVFNGTSDPDRPVILRLTYTIIE